MRICPARGDGRRATRGMPGSSRLDGLAHTVRLTRMLMIGNASGPARRVSDTLARRGATWWRDRWVRRAGRGRFHARSARLDPYLSGRVAPDVDWAARAAAAERAVVRRHLRRLAGMVPGTRIGRVRWPGSRRRAVALALLVAGAPAGLPRRRPAARPQPGRAARSPPSARTVRLRNLGSWTNDYYDDVAWFGLAVQRAGHAGAAVRAARVGAITAQLRAGWTPTAAAGSGGGAATTSRTPPPTARRDSAARGGHVELPG